MATLSGIITPSNVLTASSTATLTNKTINAANNTVTNVPLSTGVTGTLSVANGGTGITTLGTGTQILAVNSGATALEYVNAPVTGYEVCATSFCSCVCPVLNLDQGNYFKIRATGNTVVGLTGSGNSLVIDYISNQYSKLQLPSCFKTEGETGSTINSLAINNRYKLEYNCVGSEWIGKVNHVSYYPSSQTRHTVLPCTFPAGQHELFPSPKYNSPSIKRPCEPGARRTTTANLELYRRDVDNFGKKSCNWGMGGLNSAANRSLTFCYENKLYTIAPGQCVSVPITDLQCSGGTCAATFNKTAFNAIIYGYDERGMRCVHNYVNTSAYVRGIDPVGSCLTVSPLWDSFLCCCTNICLPYSQAFGQIKPLGVSSELDLLLVAETNMHFNGQNNFRIVLRCLQLSSFMNGVYEGVSSFSCLTSCLCNIAGLDSDANTCRSVASTGKAWVSFTSTPNYDFDKCTIPLKIFAHQTLDPEGAEPNRGTFSGAKFCKNPNFKIGACCIAPFCMGCFIMSGPTLCSGCSINFAGICSCGIGDTSNPCITQLCGGTGITANGQYMIAFGKSSAETNCSMNQVTVWRDCFSTTVNNCNPTIIANCSFISKFCGSSPEKSVDWKWDCMGCHIVHVPRIQTRCCESFDRAFIISRNTAGTGYVTSYNQCICTDQSTCICNTVWPRYCNYCLTRPAIVEIDISTPCHCIYSGAATCCLTCTLDSAVLCGLYYDQATCCWTVGNQRYNVTCGSNVAPCLLYRETVMCDQMTDGYAQQLKTSNGQFMNPMAIHPLSNTELFVI